MISEIEKREYAHSPAIDNFAANEHARVRIFELNEKPYYHDAVNAEEFIIPEGAVDLETECLRHSNIGKLILPQSLKTIGTSGFSFQDQLHCVLANCTIGSVEFPEGLEMLGEFAFGNSKITNMTMHSKCIDCSVYSRALKDSVIENLTVYKHGDDNIEDKIKRLFFCSIKNLTII